MNKNRQTMLATLRKKSVHTIDVKEVFTARTLSQVEIKRSSNLIGLSTRRVSKISSRHIAPIETPIVSKINHTFERDYDIQRTHEQIKQILNAEREQKKKELPLQIDFIKQKALNDKKENRKTYDADIDRLTKEMAYICDGVKLKEYEDKVKPILDQFNLFSQAEKVDLCRHKDISEDENAIQEAKVVLIFDFVQVAKKYVDISVTMVTGRQNLCSSCRTSLVGILPDDKSIIICPKCGTEKKYVRDNTYVDTGHGETEVKTKKTKTEYFDITNFEKLVNAFEGKPTGKLPAKEVIIKDLNDYFQKHNLPLCEEIQKMPPDIRGRRGNLTMHKLFDIFSEIKKQEYTDEAWLVAHIALDWDLPDLSKYKERIFSDYRKTQRGLNLLEDKGRSSSIGRHYRLFKHLELVGYPCKFDEDFKINKMKETLIANETLWKAMCEYANDDAIYFIPTV